MSFIDDIKVYFKKGYKPTQSQFYSWLDKIWWRDQSIPVDKINIGETELTPGATVAWNFDTQGSNACVTLDQDATLSISNMQKGQFGQLVVKQDGVGGHTLAMPAGFLVAYNKLGVVDLSTGAGAIDTIGFYRSEYGYLVIYNINYT